MSFDYKFTVLLMGDGSVGKNCIAETFADSKFKEAYYPTIGWDFAAKTFRMDNKAIRFFIWNSSGKEEYRLITRAPSAMSPHCVFLVYDITSKKSFDSIPKWISRFDLYGVPSGASVILVGSKLDLEQNRQVSIEEANQLAKNHNWTFIECSAKTRINIDALFETTGQLVLTKLETEKAAETQKVQKVQKARSKEEQEQKSCRCIFL